MTDAPDPAITPAIAAWLGWHAARKGRTEEGKELIPEEMLPSYEMGTDLPEDISMTCPAPEPLRRRLLRRLGGPPEPRRKAPPIEIEIVELVRRPDIGTATRYDLVLRKGEKRARMCDLRASDMLTWSRLRPIAMDSGMVLPPLERGQASQWLTAVEKALEGAASVPLAPEESEAGEIAEIVTDILETAPTWEWSDEDPYPRGIARVVNDGREGWVRGPIMDAIRTRLGKVSRVALVRALRHLNLRRAEWRIETAYLRVWCRPLKENV